MDTIDDIKKLHAEDLSTREIFTLIRDTANYFIQFSRAGDAKDLRVVLVSLYQQAYQKLDVSQRDAYGDIITRLGLCTLLTLSDEEMKDLLQKNVVRAIRLKLPLLAEFREYIDYYHDYYSDFKEAQIFKTLLQSNNELIGKWSVAQWIVLYQTEAGHRVPRGGIDRMSFINQNVEAQRLLAEERKYILAILEFFDWLSYPTPAEEEETPKESLEERAQPIVFDTKLLPLVKQGLPASLQSFEIEEVWRGVFEMLTQKKQHEADQLTTIPLSSYGLQIFLRIWLTQVLGSQDVLKTALQVVNSLKKGGHPEYLEIIYFDPADSILHWKEY